MVFKNISLPIQLNKREDAYTQSKDVSGLFVKIGIYFDNIKSRTSSLFGRFSKTRTHSSPDTIQKQNNKFDLSYLKGSRIVKIFIYIILLTALILGGAKLLSRSTSDQSTDTVEIKDARAQIDLNQEFSFPLRNENNEELARIKYILEKAELREEIIVKGKRARSVKGRIFLTINLKIVNEFNQSIEINTKDYIRLSVNGNKEEWLAPDIHNDPVEVQAISTKYSRVGFPMNDSDKDLVLRIGEINGEKQEINLDLK